MNPNDTFNTLRKAFVEYDKAERKLVAADSSLLKAQDDLHCMDGHETLTYDSVRRFTNAMRRRQKASDRKANATATASAMASVIRKLI